MLREYKDWIRDFVLSVDEHVENKCTSATEKMVEAFPELKRVRGFVFPTFDMARIEAMLPHQGMSEEELRMCWHREVGVTQHWWCETEDGQTVDPTRLQYKHWPVITYVAYVEEKHGPLPKGKCMECGELCFPPWSGVCSQKCHDRFDAYLKDEHAKLLLDRDPVTEQIQEVARGVVQDQADQGEEQ